MNILTPLRLMRPMPQSQPKPRFGSDEPKPENNAVTPETVSKPAYTRPSSREAVQDLATSLFNFERKRVAKTRQVMTFWDFLKETKENPRKYIRSSSQYTVDAIEHYNRIANVSGTINVLGREIQPVEFAKRPWVSGLVDKRDAISGQEITLNRIRTALIENAKKPHPDRMIVLHGPNGTGKSLALDVLFDTLAQYSRHDEGALYSFNWVFRDAMDDDDDFEIITPVAKGEKPSLESRRQGPMSPDDVGVTIPANLKTNPLFLLPPESRERLIRSLQHQGRLPKNFNTDYVMKGQLDSTSSRVYDALLNYYLQIYGDIKDDAKRAQKAVEGVLSHVQVVRWTMSKQDRQGLVWIPAGEAADGDVHVITPDVDWSRLPRSIKEAFRTANIHELRSLTAFANRGHIHYEDLWKNGQAHLHFLQTAEKGQITASARSGISVHENVDLTLWGTTNDANIARIQGDEDYYKSISSRMIFIPVGYELRHKSVENIYRDKFNQLTRNRPVAPYALESFALWATMTSLFPVSNYEYYKEATGDGKLFDLLKNGKLSLLQKALLYQGEDPDLYKVNPKDMTYTPDEKAVLNRQLETISNEYNYGVGRTKFLFYEGGTGLSPREGQNILEDIVRQRPKEPLTIVEVFDALGERIKHGFDFENERKAIEMAYNKLATADKKGIALPSFADTKTMLNDVKKHFQLRVRYDIQSALGIIKPDEHYEEVMKKYLAHVRKYRYPEKPEFEIPVQFREPKASLQPDESGMRYIESIINKSLFSDVSQDRKEQRDNFRRDLSGMKATWKEQNPTEDPEKNIRRVYTNYISDLKQADIENERRNLIQFLRDARTYFDSGMKILPDNKQVPAFKDALRRLKREGYPENTLFKHIQFAFEGTPEWEESSKPADKNKKS